MSDNRNNEELAQYRDYSRYSKSAKSEINLGSSKYSRGHEEPREQEYPSNANEEIAYKAAQYSRTSDRKYSHKRIKKKQNRKKRKALFGCILGLAIACVAAIALYVLYPITVTINGQEQTLTYDKSIKQAIDQSNIKVSPGDFVAVDFSVIEKGAGNNSYVELNGQEVDSLDKNLKNGDEIKYENGKDRMEDYDSIDKDIMSEAKIVGEGAIHKFEGTGELGTWSKMTGKVSHKYAERETKPASDITCKNYNPNPGKDKVIALTFDDGPSEDFTQQILDILAKYNAKATFFVIGENVETDFGRKLVSKEDAAGHLVCTHTYDHGRPAGGVDITSMSEFNQIREVTKGQETIAKVLGKNASTICRLPGGNINEVTLRAIGKYITAEIGWTLDTGDWKTPGVEKLKQNLDQASSGDVILCHDGGGDRSQTVEAISDFVKKYTEKGYRFITIEEMMQYPASQQAN